MNYPQNIIQRTPYNAKEQGISIVNNPQNIFEKFQCMKLKQNVIDFMNSMYNLLLPWKQAVAGNLYTL